MRFIKFSSDEIKFTVSHDPGVHLMDDFAFALMKIADNLGIPASLFEYRCPFDFIHEHDKWFEFYRRKYFDREPTYEIIRSMLNNDDRKVSDYVIADSNYSSAKLDLDRWKRKCEHADRNA